MTPDMESKLLQAVKDDLSCLVDEAWDKVLKSYRSGYMDFAENPANEGKTYKHKVALSVTMVQRGDECDVSSKVGGSHSWSMETEGVTVTNQMELPIDGGEDA